MQKKTTPKKAAPKKAALKKSTPKKSPLAKKAVKAAAKPKVTAMPVVAVPEPRSFMERLLEKKRAELKIREGADRALERSSWRGKTSTR